VTADCGGVHVSQLALILYSIAVMAVGFLGGVLAMVGRDG
jgi:hypothetical protein